MTEPKALVDSEFLKDLEFINDALSAAEHHDQSKFQPVSDGTDLAKRPIPMVETALSDLPPDLVVSGIVKESHLNQLLGQACLVTGATGAAIALGRGEEMVCRAAVGRDAPDLGACLDPGKGLSGACIQSRKVQQCNDTETDSRVDAEACRDLKVRSIVVLPLIDKDELFGVFEILSSRPNAFSQHDLESCQTLATRILENKKQDGKAKTAPPPEHAASSLPNLVRPAAPKKSDESRSGSPRRRRISRRRDVWTPLLGTLVIAAAILLGTLVGWRLGWQAADHKLRANSTSLGANAPSKTGQADLNTR